jgi:hypothetical protein
MMEQVYTREEGVIDRYTPQTLQIDTLRGNQMSKISLYTRQISQTDIDTIDVIGFASSSFLAFWIVYIKAFGDH